MSKNSKFPLECCADGEGKLALRRNIKSASFHARSDSEIYTTEYCRHALEKGCLVCNRLTRLDCSRRTKPGPSKERRRTNGRERPFHHHRHHHLPLPSFLPSFLPPRPSQPPPIFTGLIKLDVKNTLPCFALGLGM